MEGRRAAFLLTAVSAIVLTVDRSAMAETTWTGAAGNFQWTDPGNWNNGVPSRTVTDTAVFDDGNAAAGTVTLGTGSNFRPKNTNFRFAAGAKAYSFVGADYIDNQSNTRTFTIEAGMTNDVTFASQVRIANHTIALNGSGSLAFAKFYNENAWSDTTFNSGGWTNNNADAVLTIGTFLQIRGYTFTKSGPGTVVLTGVIDFAYGMNGTTFVSSKINVNGGTLDVSTATINLESHLDAGEALATGATYTLVNYAGGTLAGDAGFTAATGVPAGWEIAVEAENRRIVLREIPPAPKETVILVR